MIKHYLKRSTMLLAATAVAVTASADTWRDVTNQYVKDPTYIPGWQGVINAVGEGVGEVWNSAFKAYQVITDAPVGKYTLTANALYRCGNNEYSAQNMPGNANLHKAYIFINNTRTPVKGLFEEDVDPAPNGLYDANVAFGNGKYVNTVTADHPGGDLVIGIANPGCYWDEWTAFDNFELTGPNGKVNIVNGDFSEGFDSQRSWNNVNSGSKEKTPDTQKDGSSGGAYRKCGGSPYKYGQQIELPAGTYRWGMLSFHRYGSELDAQGNYYHHKTGIKQDAAYGNYGRTPKDWYLANDYDTKAIDANAYLFVSKNATCPKDLNWEDDLGDLTEGVDMRTRIKDVWEIFHGDLDAMPHNNPCGPVKDGDHGCDDAGLAYETANKCNYFHDSGNEREAAAAFYANPEKFYHYVEFTLDKPTKVWVGMGKNSDTKDGYWQPWADQTLMQLVEKTTDGDGTEANPYLITTAQDIEDMTKKIGDGKTVYFRLEEDIDMTGINHLPTMGSDGANYTNGTLHFDGNNHVISNLTSIATSYEFYYASLFGVFRGSVKNLGLVDVNLKSGLGVAGIGGYCAYTDPGTVDNVFVTGNIEGVGAYAGGIAGTNSAALTISNSYVIANVISDTKYVGGLVGRGRSSITINNCYVAGKVETTSGTASLVATTDKASGVSLTLNNVAAVNTGAADATNYGSQATGTVQTNLDNVATWAAFNQGKKYNNYPALNWQGTATGVDNIDVDDTEAPVEYYNLQGIRVENPTNGLYIKRQGSKATKVIL